MGWHLALSEAGLGTNSRSLGSLKGIPYILEQAPHGLPGELLLSCSAPRCLTEGLAPNYFSDFTSHHSPWHIYAASISLNTPGV